MEEIKDLNKWKDTTVLVEWEDQHNKGVSSPQLIYKCNEIPMKLSSRFFCRCQQAYSKIDMWGTVARIVETIGKE